MSEKAPEGYVGISPKCILGFNKVSTSVAIAKPGCDFPFSCCSLNVQNQGEEISLRLRTDDLKGFRKYESVKKTLLHEFVCSSLSDSNYVTLLLMRFLIVFLSKLFSGPHGVLSTRCRFLCFKQAGISQNT